MITINELKDRVRVIFNVSETKLNKWLETPNPSLNNNSPKKVISSGDYHLIHEMLRDLESVDRFF